jgi:hypothetical protein
MPFDRLLLRYSDGYNEWRQPPTVPDVGTTVRRGDHEWVVTEIENTTEDLAVAILKRVPKTPAATPDPSRVAFHPVVWSYRR